MLAEYAIIPNVFAQSSYASPESCDRHLRYLKDGLLSWGLVRNMHNGGWLNCVLKHRDLWDKRGREILKKLELQGRLYDSPACSKNIPDTSIEWCQEALESHMASPLQGIITDQPTADLYKGEQLIAPSTHLTEKTWWTEGNSVELKRSTEDYLKELRPILKYSNSIMFIDPHLDPTRDGDKSYKGFVELIKACGTRSPAPSIEIHRVCYTGSGKDRIVTTTLPEWEECFKSRLEQTVRQMGLSVEVFIWDDFHDRYLISNLIGIMIPNGFDAEKMPSTTRWARLDRKDRDGVVKEFAPNTPNHALRHRFNI